MYLRSNFAKLKCPKIREGVSNWKLSGRSLIKFVNNSWTILLKSSRKKIRIIS